MGKQGCYYVSNKKKFCHNVYTVARDTTGAGDVFFSTLIYLSIVSNLGVKEKTLLSHIAAGIHFAENTNFNDINLKVIHKIYSNLIK